MMNFCTFKNISVFRVFVKSVEPNNNKSVFKLIGNTLQYVVSYVKFLEDFAHTKYCSSNGKKIKKIVEYDTLDRIYKFEDKQMKTGMTLGHNCFVTPFSTKAIL
jgi:hypothetical protein